jgi:hypothetical protein
MRSVSVVVLRHAIPLCRAHMRMLHTAATCVTGILLLLLFLQPYCVGSLTHPQRSQLRLVYKVTALQACKQSEEHVVVCTQQYHGNPPVCLVGCNSCGMVLAFGSLLKHF